MAKPALDQPLIQNPWKRWTVVFGVWTLLALFFVLQSVTARLVYHESFNLKRMVGSEFIYWYVWAALSPFALYLARRYRIGGNVRRLGRREARAGELPLGRALLLHSGFALVLSALHAIFTHLLNAALVGPRRFMGETETFAMFLQRGFAVELFTGFYKYWLIVLIYWALAYSRKFREREVQAAQLETKLAQAQMQALKMQLHPHFLFNTLHSVSMLNFTDVDAANRMLVQLSDLLRITLDNSGEQEVRLRDELDFLRRYLEIEETRFQDRLTVEIDADPRLLDAWVPNLILQPLVENAIRHGVGRVARPGQIRVRAARDGNDLILEVRDNGAGLPPEWQIERDAGIGLSNTMARLRQLHPERQCFQLLPAEEGGVAARIRIPLSFAARPQEAE